MTVSAKPSAWNNVPRVQQAWTNYLRYRSSNIYIDRISSWPCGVAKLFGFWPFQSRNGALTFKWLSLESILTLANAVALLVAVITVSENRKHIFAPYAAASVKFSSTEATGQFMQVITKTTAVLSLHIFVLLHRKEVVDLWTRLVRTTNLIWSDNILGADLNLELQVKRIRRKGKFFMTLLLLLTALQTYTDSWPLIPQMFDRIPAWRAFFCSAALMWWSLMGDMYVSFVAVSATMTTIIRTAFVMLSKQLLDVSREHKSTLAAEQKKSGNVKGKSVLRVMTLGTELETIVEEMNATMRFPMLVTFGSMMINLTIAIFFVTLAVEREDMRSETFSLVLSSIMCMASFHVLCSTGSAFTAEGRHYGATLGEISMEGVPAELYCKMQLESTKFTTKPPVVSPGHYFDVNNQLMSSIITALVSYSVVLLQFDHGDKVKGSYADIGLKE